MFKLDDHDDDVEEVVKLVERWKGATVAAWLSCSLVLTFLYISTY